MLLNSPPIAAPQQAPTSGMASKSTSTGTAGCKRAVAKPKPHAIQNDSMRRNANENCRVAIPRSYPPAAPHVCPHAWQLLTGSPNSTPATTAPPHRGHLSPLAVALVDAPTGLTGSITTRFQIANLSSPVRLRTVLPQSSNMLIGSPEYCSGSSRGVAFCSSDPHDLTPPRTRPTVGVGHPSRTIFVWPCET